MSKKHRCPACNSVIRRLSATEMRDLREASGASQGDVAKALEVSGPYVSNVERGLSPVSDKMLDFYMERYDRTPDELPWWESRPWGERGPDPASIEPGDDGERWIDVYSDSCISGWFDARWNGSWCWPDGECDAPVESATHWRPKAPPPESLAEPSAVRWALPYGWEAR